MDQAEFDLLLQQADKVMAAKKPQGPAPSEPPSQGDTPQPQAGPEAPQDPTALDAQGKRPDGTPYSQPPANEPGLGQADSSTLAVTGGALKSVFETKDFLFGDTPAPDRSEFRRAVEDGTKELTDASMIDGFAAGVGQFAGAMIGLTKFAKAGQMLPWFGKAVEALPKTAETAKAALAGMIAFDPHEDRLSNLIQDTPLANPVNAYLAADPEDSAAEGRLKAAMESIGLDVAIIGVFLGSTKAWKLLRKGDAEGAARAINQMEAEKAAATVPAPETPLEEGYAQLDLAGVPAGDTLDGGPVRAPEAVTQSPVPEAGVPPQAGPQGNPSGPAPEAVQAPETQVGRTQRVESVTAAAKADEVMPARVAPRVKLTDENTEGLVQSMADDSFAMEHFGGWDYAIDGGHTFGKGEGIPYGRLNMPEDADAFLARTVDAVETRLNTMRGGAVLSDAKVEKLAQQMAATYNVDPAAVLSAINRAGIEAPKMVVMMETGYLLTNRMMQDSYALALRINLGDYAEFGSKPAALEALRQRVAFAATAYGNARAMTAAAGRSVRRMRLDYAIDPATVQGLTALDPNMLVKTLVDTGGDPKNVGRLLRASFLSKAVDTWTYMLVNNLVSGPKTQLINLTTNAYMMGARPLERMIGAGLMGNSKVFKEAVKQYAYMGTAFVDGLRFAGKAFLQNDSVLSPHNLDITQAGNAVIPQWKPWTSVGNLLHNAVLATGMRAIGLPTRLLGTADEAVKQTVYRSKVMAAAHMDGLEAGRAAGFTGKGLKDYVRTYVADKVDNAFDDMGRGTNPEALREAHTATFQQELLEGSWGKTIQLAVSRHPSARLVLPFVKTPTNVLRYGWKLTPGLNLVQKEYQQMLSGAMGAEARSQAIGQMTLGMLYMGSAAYLVSQGTITGGGPTDPKLNAALRATGWQPYSVVSENEDGTKTFTPYNRFDPAVMPIGIIADAMDAAYMGGDIEETSMAVLYGVARQLTNKTYLLGLQQAMDAMMEPDRHLQRWVGQQAANMIPMASLQRQLNTDPYMRDARTVADKMLATVPGLSQRVPPRYDAFGDPVLARRGLWSSTTDQEVDHEMIRLGLEGGSTLTPPGAKHNDVDLREITLMDGRNAYSAFQEYAGHPPGGMSLKDRIAKVITSERYLRAPDGDADVKGTRLWILSGIAGKYREAALKRLKLDPNVRDAFMTEPKRIRDHYAGLRGSTQPVPREAKDLNAVGEAFGQDLGIGDTEQ